MIIPIGARSNTVLKPVATISLIVANVLVAAISFPMARQTDRRMFEIERDRYAVEIELRGHDFGEESQADSDLDSYFQRFSDEISEADDYFDLQLSLMKASELLGIDAQSFHEYESGLQSRQIEDPLDPRYELLREWKGLQAKEKRTLDSTANFSLGLIPAKLGRVHTLITHQFLHAGIMHLVGNLIFLWMVGGLLEDTWGRGPFLLFYLMGGAAAGLIHCLQDPGSTVPLVGASGAIAAAMGAFAIRHFHTRIRLFYFFFVLFRPLWGVFHVPAYVFLPLWLGHQMFMQYLTNLMEVTPTVSYLAHIGGFLFGLGGAMLIRGSGLEDRVLAPRLQRMQVNKGVIIDPRFEVAWSHLREGRTEKARAEFYELIRDNDGNLDVLQDVANAFRQNRMDRDYERVADRLLKGLLAEAKPEEAASLVLDLVSSPEPISLSSQSMIRVGRWLSEEERYVESAGVLRAVISGEAPPEAKAKASIALSAILVDDLDQPTEAREVLEASLHPMLDDVWRERVEDQLARLEHRVPASPTLVR